MSHRKTLSVGVAIAALAAPTVAQANPQNSFQPAHVYFGAVQSGTHPNKVAVLHNGTGAPRRIKTIAVSGSGGYVFTTPQNTAMLAATGLPACKVGMKLAAGARCAIDVRVHTVRVGWWRSVLSVVYGNGWFNSAELRAHVVES